MSAVDASQSPGPVLIAHSGYRILVSIEKTGAFTLPAAAVAVRLWCKPEWTAEAKFEMIHGGTETRDTACTS